MVVTGNQQIYHNLYKTFALLDKKFPQDSAMIINAFAKVDQATVLGFSHYTTPDQLTDFVNI